MIKIKGLGSHVFWRVRKYTSCGLRVGFKELRFHLEMIYFNYRKPILRLSHKSFFEKGHQIKF